MMTWLPSSSLTSAFREPAANLSPTSALRGLRLGLLGRRIRGGPGSSAVAASAAAFAALLLILCDGLGGASYRGGLGMSAFATSALLAVAVLRGGPGETALTAPLLLDRACRLPDFVLFLDE